MKNFIDRNDEVMRLLPAESSKHIAIPSESALQVAKESKKQGLKQNFFPLCGKTFTKNAYAKTF